MARSNDRERGCSMCTLLDSVQPLYADEQWAIHPIDGPCAIAGWLLMISRRHCAGPSDMNDAEAAAFGPALRRFEHVLQRVTGARRIYTAALGEKVRHLHVHMVPRYSVMPNGAIGWSVFDLQRAAAAGEVPLVDPAEAARIHAAFTEALGG